MPDFNVVLDAGTVDDGSVNVVVEISQGSILKIEWDRKRAAFMLDRIEPHAFTKPCNYGFIPQTIDEDGDELDALIVSPEPLPTGLWTKAIVLGVLNFEDDGEGDYKIVVVPADNRDDNNAIKSLDDLGERWKEQIAHHFAHYKDITKPGTTKVLGWGDTADAIKIIKECQERFSKA